MTAELLGALVATIYGSCTVLGRKTPLFYKIIFFSMLTCLMGNVYTVLYGLLWQETGSGFHVGYLGYVGMFFFLYSSYYGAIDSLADDGRQELRPYRIAAGAAALIIFAASALMICFSSKALWLFILVIPVSFTVYFAVKHLIIPDVDMGIIKVMRTYNGLIVLLSLSMMLSVLSAPGSMSGKVGSVCAGILLALCMPAARNGVRKWYI